MEHDVNAHVLKVFHQRQMSAEQEHTGHAEELKSSEFGG